MPIDRDGDGPPLRRQDTKPGLSAGDRNSDLRATPFTDDVFSDDYESRRRGRSTGSRPLSIVVGVVLGVVIAGGAGWYFLRGSNMAMAPGADGLIKADPAPYKMKPTDPGGMQVENQDKLVYDRVTKGNAPTRVENLLPPSEEPKAPPQKPKMEAPVEAAPVSKPAPVAEAPKPAPAPEPAKPAPEPVKEAAKEPAKEPTKPMPKEELKVDPLAAEVAAAAPGRTSATGPISIVPQAAPEAAKPQLAKTEPAKAEPVKAEPPKAAPLKAEPVQTAAAAAPVTTAAVAGEGYQIQLASVLSEDAAMAEWKRISGKNKDILGSYSPVVTKADLGDKGVFYRLRAGPLADKAAAQALCASLAAQNVGCIVVKP